MLKKLHTQHEYVLKRIFYVSVAHQMKNEDGINTERMDQEMKAYAAALAAARDNPSDEFLVAAAKARTRFYALVC
jgi:MoxR-like ATPase